MKEERIEGWREMDGWRNERKEINGKKRWKNGKKNLILKKMKKI